ncbi:MAG: putative DNA-binding domain-containing protein [Rickettsiaceae bacterium]|nr:putative DNA-binding domain-containing protein [Rickettsiaceae bacterium]
MLSLETIQECLLDSIFGGKGNLAFIKVNGSIKAEHRLRVHQDTVFENFVKALEITYPGIWRLIGPDCARGVALAYSHEFINITDRSNIGGFGENFPGFLEKFTSTKHLDYLSAYARIEWLRSRSYESPNQKPISLEQFNKSLSNDPEGVLFEFNCSAFCLHTNWSLAKIQLLLDGKHECKKIDMVHEECFVLICRVRGRIETLFLEKEQWQFLFALKKGKTLGQALEQMNISNDLDTKIAKIISLLLEKEIIVNTSLSVPL